MQIPVIGEITAMRAFFLFLFFYSNDSNSLATWSTFGAGWLLSSLMDAIKVDKPQWPTVAFWGISTFVVLGYATMYLEQGRMMSFLALQSLFVPMFKLKICPKSTKEDGKKEIAFKPLILALTLLMVLLYTFDGLSGLTSGVFFLIYMPEISQRMPPLPSLRTIVFLLVVSIICAPFGLIVYGAMYHEKEMMAAPPEYMSMAKTLVGARPESVPDYYRIIGVRRGAEPQEIKKVFREMSKRYHPDKTAGHPDLQARFVEISDAVRKLTGKGSDRERYFVELERAELQDMVTRYVYFCLLFGLWMVMTLLSYMSRPKAGGPDGDGEVVETSPATPAKPKKPMTRLQWMWIILSVPIFMFYLWMESFWAEMPEELA